METKQLLKLNLGCGTDIRPGWVNMDIANLAGVDIVHNIETLPLPFADCHFDEILCQDILEHIEYIPVLKDLHRILKPGGILTIRVPHFTSRNNYIDPTHKKMFSNRTFNFFVSDSYLGRNYYFDFSYSSTISLKLTFLKRPKYFYNYLIEPFINMREGNQDLYEDTFLSRLFPALNVEVVLRK